jgi:glycosyltransferase involved in cell wall biosynthesis
MPPLLSICVPTYNRAAMLRVMLETVAPQVAELSPEVELCVSDNASPDDTQDVIGHARTLFPFHASRNEANVGPIRNYNRVVNEMSSGEYVWLLGDDDLLLPGAVRTLLSLIRERPHLDAFWINCRVGHFPRDWPAQAVGGYGGRFDCLKDDREWSEPLDRWEDLIRARTELCTQIYVHVLRRRIWQGLSENGAFGEPYTSGRWTFPHTYMIARAMFGKPAFRLGQPLFTMYPRRMEWDDKLLWIYTTAFPDLVSYFESLGLPRARSVPLRRWIASKCVECEVRALHERMTPLSPFRKACYLSRYFVQRWQKRATYSVLPAVVRDAIVARAVQCCGSLVGPH